MPQPTEALKKRIQALEQQILALKKDLRALDRQVTNVGGRFQKHQDKKISDLIKTRINTTTT